MFNALYTVQESTSTPKIYDGTTITGMLTYTLSNIVNNEDITISIYKLKYKSKQTGNNLIDISNIILYGSNNYIISPIAPIKGQILPRYINILLYGGSKIYDKNNLVFNLSYSLSGILNNDIVGVNIIYSFFKNYNIGNQIIDISFSLLYGSDSFNYLLNTFII